MDMGHGHGNMDMGGGGSQPACKISMLWNWNTIDTCFLSSTWQNTSRGMFAGSVIGIFFLVIAIEGVRRMAREYDRRIIAAARIQPSSGPSTSDLNGTKLDNGSTCMVNFTPSWTQQLIRAFAYGSQFTAAFLVMLLGMYYNGYILFAIFIGQTLGFFIFGRDTCTAQAEQATSGHCC